MRFSREDDVPGQSLLPLVATSAIVLASFMALLWAISVIRRNAGHGDVGWGLGFILVAVAALALGEAGGLRRYLVPSLVALWGLRLAGTMAWRNLVLKLHPGGEINLKEDRRYQALRRRFGARFPWVSAPLLFLPRTLLMLAMCMPLLVAQSIPGRTPLYWLDYLGLAVFSLGVLVELVADGQLLSFRMNPGGYGQVLETGLWRYSRHPNYFGAFLSQLGIFLVALAAGPSVGWTVAAPLLFGLVLVRVTGVPVCERGIDQRRPRYAEYRARTSAFFPWLPRRAPATSGQRAMSGRTAQVG